MKFRTIIIDSIALILAPESEVEDWQIMLPDGSLKGAYSLIGAFQYLENKGKSLTKTMRKQKALLVDAESR